MKLLLSTDPLGAFLRLCSALFLRFRKRLCSAMLYKVLLKALLSTLLEALHSTAPTEDLSGAPLSTALQGASEGSAQHFFYGFASGSAQHCPNIRFVRGSSQHCPSRCFWRLCSALVLMLTRGSAQQCSNRWFVRGYPQHCPTRCFWSLSLGVVRWRPESSGGGGICIQLYWRFSTGIPYLAACTTDILKT